MARKFKIEGDLHSGGFDLSLNVRHHNTQFDYVVYRPILAIWWARGCDCGLMIGKFEWRRELFKREPA